MVGLIVMLGRSFLLLATTALMNGAAWGESPVRGMYIQPPASVKPQKNPSATPTPTPTSAAGIPCAPNMLDDTCRIPSSDAILPKSDGVVDAASSKKPDAKVEPITAATAPSAAPQKKPSKKK